MVSSPMYERLKVFMQAARSNRDLDAWESDHQQTIKASKNPLSASCSTVTRKDSWEKQPMP